ncbi:MAG: leucine-rich repeat domain-containing protein, partial [Proteobacteria bacterium]|nr:leucine-rich repeat domain-containing protein [Pseudomonadota bacterium]
LQNLPALQELNLSNNSIVTIDSVLQFPLLQVLVLSSNFIEDLTPLKDLKNINYIEVVNNPLKQRTCPIEKANACRFEWMNFSVSGPINLSGTAKQRAPMPLGRRDNKI